MKNSVALTATDAPRRLMWVPVAAYLAVGAVLTTVQYAANKGGRSLSDVWIRYDGGAYLTVARDGYSYDPSDPYPEIAWFPGFPGAIRAVSSLVGDVVLSGVLVSFAAGLVATALFWTWMQRVGLEERSRRLALLVLLLFAWGWYLFGVIYADGLFLALVLGAFLLFERDRRVSGTLVAALATAVRPTGMALAVGLVVFALERDEVIRWQGIRSGTDDPASRWRPLQLRWSALRPKHAIPLLSVGGLVGYSAYLGSTWGDPLLWLSVQDKWSQGPSAGPQSWFKVHMAARIVRVHDPAYLAKALPQLLVVLLVVIAVPAIARRFGLGYAAYVGTLTLIVGLGSNDFVGPGRYMLAAFPAAALLGERLTRRTRLAALWLGVSATALVVQTALFARDVYLA